MTPTAYEALLDELTCYLQSDELAGLILDESGRYLSREAAASPDSALLRQASDSAVNLVHRAGDRAAEGAEILRAAAADRAHQLNHDVERSTLFGWEGEDGSWVLFQLFAGWMADRIDALLDER